MKTNFVKSIIAMMVVFMANSVNAQNVVTGFDTYSNLQECGEYLINHPNDTILEMSVLNRDGMRGEITRRVYVKSGTNIGIRNDTVWYKTVVIERPDPEIVQKLDSLSEESQFIENLYRSKGIARDYRYYDSPDAKAYRDSLNGDRSNPYAGKIIDVGRNKYGWNFGVHFGWSYASGVQGPIAGLGVSYDQRWWGLYVNGEIGKSKLSSNAVMAGDDYWVLRAESALKFRPIQLDDRDQNRLFLLAGVGFENFKTDSMPYELEDGTTGYLSSHGNYLYATAGVAFEHRFFATGNSIGARLQWRNTRATVQNSSDENFGSIALSIYWNFGVFRNKVSLK